MNPISDVMAAPVAATHEPLLDGCMGGRDKPGHDEGC